MGIFRRRIIQRELESLRGTVIPADRAKDLIAKLNSRRRQSISSEWEVVLAGSLSRVAEVHYEQAMGSVRPDLRVRFESDGRDMEFVADILAVSDEENNKRNPADFFFEEFRRVAAKAGLTNGGFDIRIGDRVTGKYPDKKQLLLLPPKGSIPEFLRRETKAFFREIKSEPSIPRVFKRNEPDVQFAITYNPTSGGYNTGGYAYCGLPFSLKRNPLFSGSNEKATQLKESGYERLMGIIVVDGDCHSLRSANPGAGSWSRDQIVEEFLRLHPRITFVTTTHHETQSSWTTTKETLYNKIYCQRPFNQKLTANLYQLLNAAFKSLPLPCASPQNAWRDIRAKKQIMRGCRLGDYRWSPPKKLSFSSRTFSGLIAGTLTARDFRILFYQTTPPNGGPLIHFFTRIVELGLNISHVCVEPRADEDDDFIIFSLNAPDAASDSSLANNSNCACELSMRTLIRFLAGLDYRMTSKEPNSSPLASIPGHVRNFFQNSMTEGRMLRGSELIENSERIRFSFGERDAAVSAYF